MERDEIKTLLSQLQPAIEKARKAAEAAKESENEISKSAATSWSAAGEREYTRQQARIAQENLEKLEALGREIAEAVGEAAPEMVSAVCYVTVEYENEKRNDAFYFVASPAYLAGCKLISAESPIGKAVAEKSAGEEFQFETEEAGVVRGKVISIK